MTITEIANLAGVSIATVSKIVNGKDQNINPDTRNKVLKIVKEYHYSPYSKIKDITSAKTFLLGVLFCGASKNSAIIDGIISKAQEHGYGVLLFDSHGNTEDELKHITALIKAKIDGVIWEPVCSESTQYAQYFSKHEVPVLYINAAPEFEGSYHIDYEQMGYSLTEKLLEYKHTSVACLTKKDDDVSEKVSEGFKKCLFDHQIPYSPKMLLDVDSANNLQSVFSYNITGVISPQYSWALTLYEQTGLQHYSIPEDLSIVSLKSPDTQDIICMPAVSGIRIPFSDFGSYVCENLINICEKNEAGSMPTLFGADFSLDHESSLAVPSFLRSKKILVVGSIHIDNTFSVDALPQSGKTTKILSTSLALGGKGANQSIGAAKLGREVSLIGKVGNDTDSAFVTVTLESENIAADGISRDNNAQTGKAFIYLDTDGESAITILSGANDSLSGKDIEKKEYLFKNVGYTLLSAELTLSTIIEAAKISKKNGAKNILKPATLKEIPKELFKYIDIFIPNRKEACALCPNLSSPEEQADFFLKQGIEVVIITLGHKGCYLKTKNTAKYFAAADFTPIDTTGGADAFISALASYLTVGYSLEKSIQIATYAAGFCISQQGVVPALVTKGTLEAHINRLDGELLKK